MHNLTDLWQEYDLRNTESIEQSVRHSDVVYDLVGRNYPTKYNQPPTCPCSRLVPCWLTIRTETSL